MVVYYENVRSLFFLHFLCFISSSAIGSSTKVKIFRLLDPERGQTTLDFPPAKAWNTSYSYCNTVTVSFVTQIANQLIYWKKNGKPKILDS